MGCGAGMKWIRIHTCEVCGDHARECDYDEAPVPKTTTEMDQKGLFVPFLSRCLECGTLACYSCLADGWCCRRKAEAAKLPGQLEMFT